ncbi:MAG: glycosyltransferase [Actinomycetota bacterium]|nr:glycosyltransferase [Actinomycetota bacterium]
MGLDGIEPPTVSRASVIIPVHGNWAMTAACLDSLLALADPVAFDVVVVDDSSPDDTAERLADRSQVRVVTTTVNSGFGAACNLGAASVATDILIFLNNDTRVHQGWIDSLLQTLDADESAGQVSSLILDQDGRVMDAGGIVFDDGSAWNYGRGYDADSSEVRTFRDVDYCTGTSFAIRREVFTALGGFDARYQPAYYEDVDLSFGVRSLGRRTVIQPLSRVTHLEGGTHGADGAGGLKRFQHVNRVAFHTKWRTELAANGPLTDAGDVWRGRHRRNRGMFLICEPDVPAPDRDAGSRRLLTIIDQLQDMQFALYFAPANLRELQPYTRQLEQRGVTVLTTAEQQHRFLSEAGPQLVAAMLCRPHVAHRYLDDIYRYCPDTVLIYDTVDLHALRLKRQAIVEDNRTLGRFADYEWVLERAAIEATDFTVVVSDAEHRLLASLTPDADVRTVSIFHQTAVPNPTIEGRAGIILVGNYAHLPNVDAAEWFAAKVFPLVRQAVPDAVFTLVGANVSEAVANLLAPGVRVVGWQPDIASVYRTARVAVVPLRFGAGVKGKVAEAIEHGVPLVGTRVGLEGVDLEVGRDVALHDDAEDFAAAVVTLLTDDDAWRRMAGSGQAALDRQFSAKTARRELESMLSGAPGRRTIPLTTDLGGRLS